MQLTTQTFRLSSNEKNTSYNYLYLGNDEYEIRLTVYRDCWNGVPPFDDLAALGVFDTNNLLLNTIYMDFVFLDTLPLTINSPCVLPPTNVFYEVTTYIDTITPHSGWLSISLSKML